MATLLDTLTQRTCGEACWEARQDVCRCACGGRNHGCLLVNGAPMPGRTKRTGATGYRLAAVITWAQRFDYRRLEQNPNWALQAVPKTCKWPEAQGAGENARFAWIKDTFTLGEAQQQMTEAKAQEDADHQRYHLKECDGKQMHYRYPKIAAPCGNPEFHIEKEV